MQPMFPLAQIINRIVAAGKDAKSTISKPFIGRQVDPTRHALALLQVNSHALCNIMR
jgi:hypothetical protein